MAGSVFRVADVSVRQGRAETALMTDSTITAALSLLDLPPFNLMHKASLQPDLADGRAQLRSDVSFLVKRQIDLPDVTYAVDGTSDRGQIRPAGQGPRDQRGQPEHPRRPRTVSRSAGRGGWARFPQT